MSAPSLPLIFTVRMSEALSRDEWVLACHEAGHFVVAMRFGHMLDHVDIVRSHDRNGVAVSSPGSILSRSSQIAEETAVVLLAGPAAEGRNTGAPTRSCSDSDILAARLNLARLAGGNDRNLDRRTAIVQHWAEALVARWQPDIEMLAHELLDRTSLTGDEVKTMFEGHVVEDPRPTLTSDSDPEEA